MQKRINNICKIVKSSKTDFSRGARSLVVNGRNVNKASVLWCIYTSYSRKYAAGDIPDGSSVQETAGGNTRSRGII